MRDLKHFGFWCQKVLPLVYDESLSYYEVLCKVVDYLNHVITDVNTAADDITAIKGEIAKIEKEIADIGDLSEYVDAWLDDHPEATTTVLDGSITKAKINSAFLPEIENPYVTPQMFGAVGDGITDDSTAFQAALNYARTNNIDLRLISDYFIDSDLSVPSYLRVYAAAKTEFGPTIKAGEHVTTLFDCLGVANCFKDFCVDLGGYRSGTKAFNFPGVSNNVDSELVNIQISGFDVAVTVKGRNLLCRDCMFAACRIGVLYDPPVISAEAGGQWRGWIIDGCRFHEIGCFSDVAYFEGSYCVYCSDRVYSNIMVTNCHADLCGTFYGGFGTNVLISDTFAECYKKPVIDLGGGESGLPGNVGVISITNSYLVGKRGSVAVGVTVDYPENIIKCVDYGRLNVSGNVLKFSGDAIVNAEGNTYVNVSSNISSSAGMANDGDNVLVRANDNIELYIEGNKSFGNSTEIIAGSNNTGVLRDNEHYLYTYSPTGMTADKPKVTLFTSAANTPIEISDVPMHFYVRLTDGHTMFECARYDQYVSGGVIVAADGSTMTTLSWIYDNVELTLTPVLRVFDLSDMSSQTYAYTLTFLVDIN